jgi:hypothetical protein
MNQFNISQVKYNDSKPIDEFLKIERTWTQAKIDGVGWFANTPSLLNSAIETIWKTEYKLNKDAQDVAIFLVLIHQIDTLKQLFKEEKNLVLEQFFSNDFTIPQNQQSAMANAVVLKSRGRYRLAACFYLLADDQNSAIEILLKDLLDIQLAAMVYTSTSKYKGFRDLFESENQHYLQHDPFLKLC